MKAFEEALGKAAQLTNHAQTDNERTLASSTGGVERLKALRLLADARIQSATGQIMAEIRAGHPEAKSLLLSGRTSVGLKPPKELADHLARIIGRVLTDPGAQAITYSAWTEELNKAFGNRFNPGTFFSKKRLGKQLRARLDNTFAARGLPPLPESCETLAQAMKAAKAARLGKRENTTLFAGGVGRIVGSQLVVGHNTFAIEQHGGHDCIRVPRGDGSRGRMRLGDLEQFLSGSGLGFGGGSPSTSPVCNTVGEPAQSPDLASTEHIAPEGWAGSPEISPILGDALPVADTPEPETPGLTDRIARLNGGAAERRAREQANATAIAAVQASGIDPLEL